jgi:hypothetical protein
VDAGARCPSGLLHASLSRWARELVLALKSKDDPKGVQRNAGFQLGSGCCRSTRLTVGAAVGQHQPAATVCFQVDRFGSASSGLRTAPPPSLSTWV